MQNTRLNSLVGTITAQARRWLFNPWRQLSLLVISVFFGFFLGSAISLVSGQRGYLDIVVAGILLASTEIIDRIYYSRIWQSRRALWLEALNALKIGLIYSLFLEAFKLGS